MGRLLFNICATSSAIGGVCGLVGAFREIRTLSFKQDPDHFITQCVCLPPVCTVAGALIGAIPPFGAYVAYRIITDKD